MLDVILELVAEIFDKTNYGHRRGIAERANGAALDLRRHIGEQIQIFQAPVAVLDAVKYP